MAIDFTALNNACKLYYSMDNADISGSTILDLTPNNNDGTLMNSPTTGAVGILNEALSFDGIDDYIDTNYDLGSSYTISMWAYMPTFDELRVLAGIRDSFSNNREFYLGHSDSNTLFLQYYDSSSNGAGTISGTITENSWNRIVITRDGNNIELYVDNNLQGVDSTAGKNNPTQNLIIGKNGEPSIQYFNGLIDEVSIFNKVLTLEEIEFLYNQGAPTVNQQYPFSTAVVYEIKGQVTLSGTATQGATLRLYDQTEGTYEGSTTTDVSGNYLFENLNETNEYHVSVEYDDGTTKYNDESKPYVTPTEQ